MMAKSLYRQSTFASPGPLPDRPAAEVIEYRRVCLGATELATWTRALAANTECYRASGSW
jgi:hypothetical protein